MQIKIQIKGRIFSISIGRKTDWFEQSYLLSIAEEWYDENMSVEYAKMLYSFWMEK